MSKNIGNKALCIFRDGDKLLLSEGFDPAKNEHYLRPIGGSIEFGERAIDAVIREVKEEIDADIHPPRLLGVLENLFYFDGREGHEVVFVYEAEFLEPERYQNRIVTGVETSGDTLTLRWASPQEIDALPIYPAGIKPLLARESS